MSFGDNTTNRETADLTDARPNPQPAPPASSQALWSLTFILLMLITLIGSMNGNGLNNGVSLIVEAAGAPAVVTGIVIGVFSFMALVGRAFCGNLSDRIGRKKVILTGAAAMCLGCLVPLPFANVYLMIPCRIIMGIGFAMVTTTTAAATADIIPKDRMGQGLGIQGLAHALAMALGPSCGIFLATLGGRFALFGGFLVLAAAAFCLTLFCKFPRLDIPDPAPAFDSVADDHRSSGLFSRMVFTLIERAALPSMFVLILLNLSNSIFCSFISLYSVTFDVPGASIFFTVSAAVMIVTRLLFSRFFDTVHVNLFLVPSFLCGIIGLLLLLFFKSEAILIATGVFNGIFGGLTTPLVIAEALKRSPDSRHGAASATVYIGGDIGMGLGSLAWGIVIDILGFNALFVGGIFFLVVDIFYVVYIYRKPVRIS